MTGEKKLTKKRVKEAPQIHGVKSNKPEEITQEDKKDIQVIERTITENRGGDVEMVWKGLTRPQIDLMKRTVAKDATDDELRMFLTVCVSSNLNPFLRQVHFVKRWDSKIGKEVGTIQVGIDGFRAIAESGGQYAGSADAVFEGEEVMAIETGKDKKVITNVTHPKSAKVVVYKLMDGQRYPFSATARWSEYYPGGRQGYMWHKMPYGQLGKCAEALALRKAFPKLLSGLYAPEEMDQAIASSSSDNRLEENKVEKARRVIEANIDVAELQELAGKIEASTRYSKEEKVKIIEIIIERVKMLDGKVAK